MSKQDLSERHDPFGDSGFETEVSSFSPKKPSDKKKPDQKETFDAAKKHGYERRITAKNENPKVPEPVDPTKPIQFRVTEADFLAFSEQAGREFGFTKGAKSQLFQKIWREYQARLKKQA